MPPRPGEAVRRPPAPTRAPALYFDQMDYRVPGGHRPRRRSRSTSTSSSSTARVARTCRSPASPAWRPRPASRCSCSTRCSPPACSARRASTPRRWCSPSRARTCCSSTSPTSASTTTCATQYADLGLPAEPFASVGFFAPPMPGDTTGRPHVTGRTSGVERVLVDPAEFCAASCCRTCSPTSRTSGTSTRWSSTRSPAGCAATPIPPALDGAVTIDGPRPRTWADLVD